VEWIFPTAGWFSNARLKYQGAVIGHDPSCEVNLLNLSTEHKYKSWSRSSFWSLFRWNFSYPFYFLTRATGHCPSKDEVYRLRTYLEHGGFLYIDDDYGLDNAVRREWKKFFRRMILLNFLLVRSLSFIYNFWNVRQKPHEHDKKYSKRIWNFGKQQISSLLHFWIEPNDGWADAKFMMILPRRERIWSSG